MDYSNLIILKVTGGVESIGNDCAMCAGYWILDWLRFNKSISIFFFLGVCDIFLSFTSVFAEVLPVSQAFADQFNEKISIELAAMDLFWNS